MVTYCDCELCLCDIVNLFHCNCIYLVISCRQMIGFLISLCCADLGQDTPVKKNSFNLSEFFSQLKNKYIKYTLLLGPISPRGWMCMQGLDGAK